VTNAEVNFRLAGGPQPLILVPVRVNDADARDFILDTGAGTSLLSPQLARELGVEATGKRQAQVAGGRVDVGLGRVASLSVGGASAEDLEVAIVNLDDLGRAVGARVEGDLGHNFLKSFRVTVDYGRGVLRLRSGRYESFGAATLREVGFRLAAPAKPLVLVSVLVNGARAEEFAIDTGCSTTMISPALAADFGVRAGASAPVSTGGGHALAASFGKLDSLALAGACARDLPVVITDAFRALNEATGASFRGIVGHNFLKAFALTIDYPASTLSLSPNKI